MNQSHPDNFRSEAKLAWVGLLLASFALGALIVWTLSNQHLFLSSSTDRAGMVSSSSSISDPSQPQPPSADVEPIVETVAVEPLVVEPLVNEQTTINRVDVLNEQSPVATVESPAEQFARRIKEKPKVVEALQAEETPVEAAPIEVVSVGVAQAEAAPVEAAKVEAAKVEAAKVEAAKVEAAKAEAAKAEAAKAEAAKAEAVKVEAAKAEAAKAEAVKVEAVKVEAVKVEAVKVEAAKVEAAKVEAAKVEAAKVEAAKVQPDVVPAKKAGVGNTPPRRSVAAVSSEPDTAFTKLRREELAMLSDLSANLQIDAQATALDSESSSVLYEVFELLFLYSEVPVAVTVQSNDTGSRLRNSVLAQQRGDQIVDYLVLSGLDRDRFTIITEPAEELLAGSHRIAIQATLDR